MRGMNWTPDDEALIKRLWLSGYTGSEISGLTGMTRHRVLSKVRRMRLTRALRFADEVAAYGCVERAAVAVGVSVERGWRMFEEMRKGLGGQAR